MWIFTQHGLLSIVENTDEKNTLLVRARQSHHITDNFKSSVPKYSPDRDYHWSSIINKEIVAKRLGEIILEIDYPNFKNSVDKELKSVYGEIWGVAMALQKDKYARVQ
jgi:hypothetical protein